MIKNKIKTINYITKDDNFMNQKFININDYMKFQTDRKIAMHEYERLKEERFDLNHQIHQRT